MHADEVVWRFYELLSARSQAEIEELRARNDPLALKAEFGRELVASFHGALAADEAMGLSAASTSAMACLMKARKSKCQRMESDCSWQRGLSVAPLVASTSEAKRLISQGGARARCQPGCGAGSGKPT